MATDCLASTGSNTFLLIAISVVAIAAGVALVRSGKARMLALALIIGASGFLFSQSTAKPASAACPTTTTSAAPVTTTTAAGPLVLVFVGQANNTSLDNLPSPESFTICEHGASPSNCAVYDAGTETIAPASSKALFLSSANSTLDVSATQTACYMQLWSTAPSLSDVETNYTATNVAGPGLLLTLDSGSSATTTAHFSNGNVVYVTASNNC